MGRRLAAVVLVVAVIAVVVSTAGVPIGEGPDAVDPDGDLTIDATDSQYAYHQQQTNETIVDLTPANPHLDAGVNPEAITQIGEVFRIYNEHTAPVELWIAEQPSGVTFTHDQQALTESTAVIIPPETAVPVGVTVDTTGETIVTEDDFAIQAESREEEPPSPAPSPDPDPELTVTSPSTGERMMTARHPEPDETLRATFDSFILPEAAVEIDAIAVDPAVQADFDIELVTTSLADVQRPANVTALGGFNLTSQSPVTSTPMEATTVEFAVRNEYTDNQSVAIYRQTDTGWESYPAHPVVRDAEWTRMEATVTENSTMLVGLEEAPVAIVDRDIDPVTVESGTPVTVTATVENTGLETESAVIPVGTDSEVVDTQAVTLEPGETTTVETAFTPTTTGTETVYVDGEVAATVEVTDATEQAAIGPLDAVLLISVTLIALIALRQFQKRRGQ